MNKVETVSAFAVGDKVRVKIRCRPAYTRHTWNRIGTVTSTTFRPQTGIRRYMVGYENAEQPDYDFLVPIREEHLERVAESEPQAPSHKLPRNYMHDCCESGCARGGQLHPENDYAHWYCLTHWRALWEREQPPQLVQQPLWATEQQVRA